MVFQVDSALYQRILISTILFMFFLLILLADVTRMLSDELARIKKCFGVGLGDARLRGHLIAMIMAVGAIIMILIMIGAKIEHR